MPSTGTEWLKSSYSGGGGDNCVEIAVARDRVLVRDSKETRRPALALSPGAWSDFTAAVAVSPR
ncbi:DUF397 domain-containing protein [Streptomyces zingiberis]|uniref:DUF397 domain-containing protein n=1 Tax=Streptomyces zingiberis TaxID=2053010 RepID=A0ABX1BZ98_9ACTN|nr:DUF397 domain-containing protein [Streptomyces zingiberis]NJQ02438.1 DUF397 domain-containing protein [Streptomyces zingiberis]